MVEGPSHTVEGPSSMVGWAESVVEEFNRTVGRGGQAMREWGHVVEGADRPGRSADRKA